MRGPDIRSLNGATLEFRSPTLEAAYVLTDLPNRTTTARRTCIIAVALYAMYGFIDYLTLSPIFSRPSALPADLLFAWIVRAIFCSTCLIAYFAIRGASDRAIQITLSGLALLANIGLLAIMLHVGPPNGDLIRLSYFVGPMQISMFVLVMSALRWTYAQPIALAIMLSYFACSRNFPYTTGFSVNGVLAFLNFHVIGSVACYSIERSSRMDFVHKLRAKELLDSMLPLPVSDRLASGGEWPPSRVDSATILFADIAGFTVRSRQRSPEQIVAFLDDLVSTFDRIARAHGIDRIRTVGDSVMLSSGVPTPRSDHIRVMADVALKMRKNAVGVIEKHDMQVQVRFGIDTGSVIAAVIGQKKTVYDIWGDAVNAASRMEKSAEPGMIHVTRAFYEALKHDYTFEARKGVTLEGIGPVESFYLQGEAHPFDDSPNQ